MELPKGKTMPSGRVIASEVPSSDSDKITVVDPYATFSGMNWR